MKSMKALRITLWTLLSLLLVCAAVIVGLLNSQLGTWTIHKALEHVPQVKVESLSGTLLDELQIQGLELDLPQAQGRIAELRTGLNIRCLWQRKLCVKRTHLSGVDIALLASEQTTVASSGAALNLPMAFELRQLTIDNTQITLPDHSKIQLVDMTTALAISQNESELPILAPLSLNMAQLTLTLPGQTATTPQPSVSPTETTTAPPLSVQNSVLLVQHYQQQLLTQLHQAQDALGQVRRYEFDPAPLLASLPPLALPINMPDISVQIDALAVDAGTQTLLSPSALSISVGLHSSWLLHRLTLTNQHLDLLLQGELTAAYEHELTLEAQWQPRWIAELIPTALTGIEGMLNTLSMKSHGHVLAPQLSLSASGEMDIKAGISLDLREPLLPTAIDIQWSAFAVQRPQLQLALAPGEVALNGNLRRATANIDLTLQSLTIPQKISLNNAGMRCALNLQAQSLRSENCLVQLAQTTVPWTLSIPLEAAPDTDFAFTTELALKAQEPLWQWQVAGQPLQAALGELSLDNLALSLTLSSDNAQLTQQAEGSWQNAPFSQAIQLSANLGQDALSLTIDELTGQFREFGLSVDALTATLRAEQTELSPVQLTVSREQAPLINATLTLQPISFAQPTIAGQWQLAEAPLSGMLELLHSLTNQQDIIQTDAQYALSGEFNWANERLTFTSQAKLSPSQWQVGEQIQTKLATAELSGKGQWQTDEPITAITTRWQAAVTGENIGDIGIEIDYNDKLAVYANLQSVNLGLFADMVPTLSRFTGLASANIALQQVQQDFVINGVVVVPELDLALAEIPPSVASPHKDLLFSAPVEQVFSAPKAEKSVLPYGIKMDINAIIDPLQTDKVRLEALDFATALNGALNVKLDNNNLSVIGDLNLRQGTYQAYGQDLVIRQGKLTFNGPVALPLIAIEAIRNPKTMNDDVVAGIRVQGLSDNLRAELFSEPRLENPDILSYLIRGKGLNASSDENNSVLLTNALLGVGLGQSEGGITRLGDKLGVDELALSTQGAGDQTQLGISGKLNDRLSIEYRVGLFTELAELGLRYELRPNLYVEAISGANNALDIFYQLAIGARDAQPQPDAMSPEEQAIGSPDASISQ